MPKKLSVTEVFNRIKAKHPSFEILSKDYTGAHSLLKFRCKICKSIWKASYTNIIHGNTGCLKCAKQQVRGVLSLSTDEAFKRIKAKHPSIQILSDCYVNSHSCLSLKCNKCGNRWKARYTSLFHSETGCLKCARIQKAKEQRLLATEAFNYIKAKHPSFEILSKDYTDAHAPLKIRCAKGHIWGATYSNLVHRSTQCPKCTRKMTSGEKIVYDLLIRCGLRLVERI